MNPPMGVSSELSWLLFVTALKVAGILVVLCGGPLIGLGMWVFHQLRGRVEVLDQCVDRRFEALATARQEGYERQQQRHVESLQRLTALETNHAYTHGTLAAIDAKLDRLLGGRSRGAGGD